MVIRAPTFNGIKIVETHLLNPDLKRAAHMLSNN